MGQDQVLTVDELERIVRQGELRFIYWDARRAGFGGQSDISSWVSANCTPFSGFETATRNMGAPNGTGTGSNNSTNQTDGGFFQGPGGLQGSLYDCGQ